MTVNGRPQSSRVAVVVLVVAVVVASVVSPPVASARVAGDPAVGPSIRPRPSAPVAQQAAAHLRIDRSAPGAGAAAPAERVAGAADAADVVVEVVPSGATDAASDAVAAVGGEVRGVVPDELLLAAVPASSIGALQAAPAVRAVRRPLRAAPLAGWDVPVGDTVPGLITDASGSSEQVGKTAVGAWTAAGHRGQGVKVGIIDAFDGDVWSAAQAYGVVPVPAGTFCQRSGLSCSVWTGHSFHGAAVAEVVHDQAPDAQLYLASVETAPEYIAALDWFAAQGVTIVNHSQTARFDGPGDGTGPFAAVVAYAEAHGMLWVQSAGNAAGSPEASGSYWRGPHVDADLDGFHEFAAGDEVLDLDCAYLSGVRWSDWGEGEGTTDFDVVLVAMPGQEVLASSTYPNSTGIAAEWPDPLCTPGQWVGLIVHRYAPGTIEAQPDTIEVLGNGTAFEHWSNPSSASGPFADAAGTGMLTVGAIDPAIGATAAWYTSWGPTNDGRTKPDVSAASCVASLVASLVGWSCFNGTSAAAPTVAGAAAAVASSGVAVAPSDLAAFVATNVIDRGAAGPDQVTGRGEVVLGPPPVDGVVNDDLADAWPLKPGRTLGRTDEATREGDEPVHAGVPGAHSVWFRVTAPRTTTLTLRTEGSTYDTSLAVYAGDSYPLTLVAADDDGGPAGSSRLEVSVSQGSTYRIAVDGKAGASGVLWLSATLSGSCTAPFSDVGPTHRFCDPITWAAGTGVADGYGDGTYRPGTSVSRQAMVAFLRRLAGSPPVPAGAPSFPDVPPSSPFHDDVRWAAAVGVTTGYPDGLFRPGYPVSRQAMAAFLHRLSGEPGVPPRAPVFRDVADDHPFAHDIGWLAGSGVASGYGDGTFKPTTAVSRQAMASFLWLWSGR